MNVARFALVGTSCIAGGCQVDAPNDVGQVTAADSGTGTTGNSGASESSGGEGGDDSGGHDSTGETLEPVSYCCADDGSGITDCATGEVIVTCMESAACDPSSLQCVDGCEAARESQDSRGCDYHAVALPAANSRTCFAAYVSNDWFRAAKIGMTYGGKPVDLERSLVALSDDQDSPLVGLLDPEDGVAPGQSAAVLLTGACENIVDGARPSTSDGFLEGGVAPSFHLTSTMPVVMHQILPVDDVHGEISFLGASLLLATSSWDTAFVTFAAASGAAQGSPAPNIAIVAAQDGTQVTVTSAVGLEAGEGLPDVVDGTPAVFTLNAGERALFSQLEEGSAVVDATAPVGVFVGHTNGRFPGAGSDGGDHMEQMLPPVRSLGARYGAASVRRGADDEPVTWRLVGVVDDTELSWSNDVGGPATLQRGESAWVNHRDAFIVQAQDEAHPFYLFNYMSNADASPGLRQLLDWRQGGPELAVAVTPEQFLASYVLYADPQWETQLVAVRKHKDANNDDIAGAFDDVYLDCGGEGNDQAMVGWKPIGGADSDLESVRLWLPIHCLGRLRAYSDTPFGLHIWGVGNGVSYGVPAGMGLSSLNDVVVIPEG